MVRTLIRLKNDKAQAAATKMTLERLGMNVLWEYPFDVISCEVPSDRVSYVKTFKSLEFCEEVEPYKLYGYHRISKEALLEISEQEIIAHKVFDML